LIYIYTRGCPCSATGVELYLHHINVCKRLSQREIIY
jgi:hypothetical protein